MTQENSPQDAKPNTNDPAPQDSGEPAVPAKAPATKPRKRRWLRRLMFIGGGLVGLLLLLVLMVPTIASMGWVRTLVVGKVNENLNGHVQIADWSVGWTGGLHADGIKVYDDQNRQVLELAHVSTQLSLINAIKGKFDIGDTVIDGLDFNAIRYPDGSLNLQSLAKPSKAPATPATPAKDSKPNETKTANVKLPEVHGQLRLINCRGTLENITRDLKTGKEQHDMVKFTSIKGDVKITDLNSPITNSFEIVQETGGAGPGTLGLSGSALIAKGNVLLPPEQMTVSQQISLGNIDLRSVAFALPPTITMLQGNSAGTITLSLQPGQGALLEGSIQTKAFKFGGPIIEGDTYLADSATITIPKTTVDMSTGFGGDFQANRLRVGDGANQAITIAITNTVGGKTSQSTVKLIADTTLGALQNVGANKLPGANGVIRVDVDLDLVPLAAMVPHVLNMWEGMTLNVGRLADVLEVRLTPTQTNVIETLALSPITGEHKDHKKISIDPLNLSLKATDRGGLAGKIPDLRDIFLTLTTHTDPAAGWASANITAATLAELKGAIHADLQRAQAQAGQLIDMGDMKLGGTVDVALDTKGSLLDEPKPGQTQTSSISANTTVRNLTVDGLVDQPPVKEPFIGINIFANLERTTQNFIQAIRNLDMHIIAGNEAKPSINVTAKGSYDLTKQTAASAAEKPIELAAYLDLPQIQNEFGAFLKPLTDARLKFNGGMVGVTAKVTYDGTKAVVDPQLNLKDIVLDKNDGAQHVLSHYDLQANAPLVYNSEGGVTTISIDKMLIGDNTAMVRLENTGGPLKVVMTADGRMQPSLNLHVMSIDLKQINDVLQGLSTEIVATTAEGQTLKSGVLSGTLNLVSADNHQLHLGGDLAVNNITITAPQAQGLQNEQLRFTLDAGAADDLSSASVNRIDAVGSFLNAHISDVGVQLKQGTGKDATAVATLDMLRKATVKVEFPSLAKLQTVMDAFSPPVKAATPTPVVAASTPARSARTSRAVAAKPATPATPTPEAPAEPMKLAAGTASLVLNVTREGDHLSILPNLGVRNLELRKPDGTNATIGSVDVLATELALMVNVAPPAAASTKPTTQPSIMDQIRELKISQLAIRLPNAGTEFNVNGSVVDLANTRTFRGLGADLTYDAAKIWPVLVPLIFDAKAQADWKTAKVAGAYKKHINIAGSFPATLAAGQQPITGVAADGGITLDLFDGQGVTLSKFDLPYMLQNGILSIAYAGKPAGQNYPPPAPMNGGMLDLGGLSVDLASEHMRLNMPPAKKLLNNVSLNPAFAHLFGDYINNPLFVGADQAAGQMTMTVAKCENLPLDATMTEAVPSNVGYFEMNASIARVQIGNANLQKLSSALGSAKLFGSKTLAVNSLQGEIQSLHVVVQHGVTTQDLVMTFGEGKRPLHMFGDVAMATKQMHMTMDFPLALFGAQNDKTLLALTGGTGSLKFPLVGTPDAFSVDLAGFTGQFGADKLLQGFLKPGGASAGQPASQPSKDSNPLGGLGDLLNNINKKKE